MSSPPPRIGIRTALARQSAGGIHECLDPQFARDALYRGAGEPLGSDRPSRSSRSRVPPAFRSQRSPGLDARTARRRSRKLLFPGPGMLAAAAGLYSRNLQKNLRLGLDNPIGSVYLESSWPYLSWLISMVRWIVRLGADSRRSRR